MLLLRACVLRTSPFTKPSSFAVIVAKIPSAIFGRLGVATKQQSSFRSSAVPRDARKCVKYSVDES